MNELTNPELTNSDATQPELTPAATETIGTENAASQIDHNVVAETPAIVDSVLTTDEHSDDADVNEEERELHELEDELPNFASFSNWDNSWRDFG